MHYFLRFSITHIVTYIDFIWSLISSSFLLLLYLRHEESIATIIDRHSYVKTKNKSTVDIGQEY
jgi:hypothetical protein